MAIKMKAWINGQIISEEKIFISSADKGLRYGSGLFETLRIYKSRPFLLEEHLKRMFHSAWQLGFTPRDYSQDKLAMASESLINCNEITEGVLHIYWTEGGLLWMTCTNGIPYPQELQESGIRAAISRIRRNETSPLVGMKTFNYLDNILAKKEAVDQGFQEAIFFNTKNFLAEGAVSNIFLVNKGTIITPDIASGILPGIARKTVLELAGDYSAKEREISSEELETTEECFLTNSLMEIMPVININGKQIGEGTPGPITRKLQISYRNLRS